MAGRGGGGGEVDLLFDILSPNFNISHKGVKKLIITIILVFLHSPK